MTHAQQFSAVIEKEDGWYVALCPELDVASQGKSIEDALENLREAVGLYLDDEDVKAMLKNKPVSNPILTTFTV
ncbi:type II toxin-antitoxin system HicB family antitoxin [Candidatus Micrarchaeota archaeon]|nr:type II toxin-antitoxin system HicB family antitoxin [Candidatus Micrarchaeota archaeon]